MSYDLVLLLDEHPTSDDILRGLDAAGENLGVRAVADGAVVQLCGDDGVPMVSIEIPLLVQVPGEVERMLGPAAGSGVGPGVGPGVGMVKTPTWWVEVRAAPEEQSRRIARRYADDQVARLGGRVCTTSPIAAGQEKR